MAKKAKKAKKRKAAKTERNILADEEGRVGWVGSLGTKTY